jgi:hypothetical protein
MAVFAPKWGRSTVYLRPTQLPCEKRDALGRIGTTVEISGEGNNPASLCWPPTSSEGWTLER